MTRRIVLGFLSLPLVLGSGFAGPVGERIESSWNANWTFVWGQSGTGCETWGYSCEFSCAAFDTLSIEADHHTYEPYYDARTGRWLQRYVALPIDVVAVCGDVELRCLGEGHCQTAAEVVTRNPDIGRCYSLKGGFASCRAAESNGPAHVACGQSTRALYDRPATRPQYDSMHRDCEWLVTYDLWLWSYGQVRKMDDIPEIKAPPCSPIPCDD